jgi:lipoprotein
MKKIFVMVIFLALFSCNNSAKKPKNLISKEKLSEVIADFAIYEQAYVIQPKMDLEDANLFVLKKHNISARDFKDSYNYYILDSKSLNEIYDNAKKIILEKDPKMKEYLKKNKFEDNPKQ